MSQEKYLVIRDREGMLTPQCWNLMSETSSVTREFYHVVLGVVREVFYGGRWQALYLADEWKKVGDYVAHHLIDDVYFKCIKQAIDHAGASAEQYIQELRQTEFSSLDSSELFSNATQIQQQWLAYDEVNVYAWLLGGDLFKQLVEEQLSVPHDEFLVLTTPDVKTYVNQLERQLLEAALDVKRDKKDIDTIAQSLSDEFGWIPFGYDGPVYWDRYYFIERLQRSVSQGVESLDLERDRYTHADQKALQKKVDIIQNYRLGDHTCILIDRVDQLALWTDERKKLDFMLHYYYSLVLEELGRRYNCSVSQLKYLFTEELPDIERNREKLLARADWRINNEFMIEYRRGAGGVVSEQTKRDILRVAQSVDDTSEIRGEVACSGVLDTYQGRVKVVLSSRDIGKVETGDFIVATMTTPDYIVAMQRAAGFITDEGGVTCHAAIVAREMNKPCVIGTRTATKVLHDGQQIEVDTDSGIVRVI